MSKTAAYEMLRPPVEITIEHESSGEQRSVACVTRALRRPSKGAAQPAPADMTCTAGQKELFR